MEVGVIIVAIGSFLGLWGCGSSPARSGDARSDDGRVDDENNGRSDGSDVSIGDAPNNISKDAADAGVDRYIDGRPVGGDGGDGGGDGNFGGRPGINDAYAPLPFCSGRNIFIIKENTGIGFCGTNPSTLYRFPISENLSSVVPESLLDLPREIGGRAVTPATIRDGGPEKILLTMQNSPVDTAATFLMFDLSAETFVGPQVSATGLQIGTNPIGDPVPIGGLNDLAFIGGEFWGVLSNPNPEGSYRFGFGLALPQTAEGFVDTGVAPNEAGIVENILSNREEGFGEEVEPGSHFSFRTTYRLPTNVEGLGVDSIIIQTSGTLEEPASIDVANRSTHQLLENRNVSLGMRALSVLPRIAVDEAGLMVYPATATSLWEVDLSEGAPSEQENEIHLADDLSGQIFSTVMLGGQIVVGDSDGQILFVDLSEATWGTVSRIIDVGSGLSNLAVDGDGHLFVSVEETVEGTTPHIVAINP